MGTAWVELQARHTALRGLLLITSPPFPTPQVSAPQASEYHDDAIFG